MCSGIFIVIMISGIKRFKGIRFSDMKEFTVEDALYFYSMLSLGHKDEFDAYIISAVNEGADRNSFIYNLYLELDSDRGLSELLSDKLSHYFANKKKDFYADDRYKANCRITAFYKGQYDNKTMSSKTIANEFGKISDITSCDAFKKIAESFQGADSPALENAFAEFLNTGKFVYGNFNEDIAKDRYDPYKNLKQGRLKNASMGVIDDMMNMHFGKDVKLVKCGGPVQMCVFNMEYIYLPDESRITFDCERGIICSYIDRKDEKRIWPLNIYPGENYCHDVYDVSEVKKVVKLTAQTIKGK